MAGQREKRKKKDETKEERFKRLMARRAVRAEDDLRLIGNLANQAHYAWDEAEVRAVFERLEGALLAAKIRFLPDDHYWTQLEEQ